MAYTLRLPDALDAAARARADYLGISLNALLCVALDAYLRAPSAPIHPGAAGVPHPDAGRVDSVLEPATGGGNDSPSKTRDNPPPPAQKLTRKERHALYKAELEAKRRAIKAMSS